MNKVLYIIFISLFSLTIISCAKKSSTSSSSTTSSGLYVVGDNGTILTSTDGTTWDNSSSYDTPSRLRSVIYANSTFMTVGYWDEIILSSSDGITWDNKRSGTGNLRGVAYGNNKFVVVGLSGHISTSSDGTSWDNRTSGTTAGLYGLK